MPIGTISGSEWVAAAGTANVVQRDCPVPVDTADGDFLVAYAVLSQDDAAATGILSAGWDVAATFARKSTAPATGVSAVLTRVWNDGDPTVFTFTKTGSALSGTFSVVMVKVPGANPTLPFAPTALNGTSDNSASVTCPSVTVPSGLASDAAVIRFYHIYYYSAAKINTDTWSISLMTSFTEYADQSGDWASVGAAARLAPAGSVANPVATAGGFQAGSTGRGVSMVVTPAVVVAPTVEPGRRMLLGVS